MSWFPKKTVIAPFDFSDESFAALDVALQVAEDPAGVHVVYVLEDLSPVEPGELWRTVDHDSRRTHALQAMNERLSDERFTAINRSIEFGNPGQEIAEYAERNEADLIVMPSHGRRGISRLLIGSVAERTIRLAKCPVLILRD